MHKKTIALFYVPASLLLGLGYTLHGSIGVILLAIGGILGVVAWIGTLMATAKLKRWGWLICTIIFSHITELVYLIVGPGLQ